MCVYDTKFFDHLNNAYFGGFDNVWTKKKKCFTNILDRLKFVVTIIIDYYGWTFINCYVAVVIVAFIIIATNAIVVELCNGIMYF